MKLHLDFETRSEVDIKKVGAWAYAQHPTTDILCLAFALGDEPVKVLTAAEVRNRASSGARSLETTISRAGVLSAHNVQFEYAVWLYIMHGRYRYPDFSSPKLWDCTMSRALMCGFPAALDDAADALKLPIRKDLEGRAVMHKLSKPYDVDIFGEPVFRTPETHPGLHQRLYQYCAQDVETERMLDKALPAIQPLDRLTWELDLVINRRGVQVDRELAARAAGIAETLTVRLNARLKGLTCGRVDKATRVQALKYYLAETDGIYSEKLDKVAVLDLETDPDVSAHAKEVVSIRKQVGKSSTSKFAKAVEAACPADGRVRGSLLWHGSHTGRWSGRLIQPQNYPQGFATHAEQDPVVRQAMTGDADAFAKAHGNAAMDQLSKLLRATIVAAPGKRLLAADYNAIEARVLFWLAGQTDALECYRRGDSPYVEMANRIYGRTDCSKKGTPKEYDLGKRAVLGCGYGMGWEKFQDTVKTQAGVVISDDLAQRAVNAYRERYPAVRQLWYAVERAAINAVKAATAGRVFTCGGERIAWGMSQDRRFLACRLPSGRFLRYFKPRVRAVPDKFDPERTREELIYWGEHPKTHQWVELKTYGGALVENVVQAVARDFMAHGMMRVEAADFPLVLTVHDELVAEVSDMVAESPTLRDFIREMTTLPAWGADCPLAAEGWIGDRYRK